MDTPYPTTATLPDWLDPTPWLEQSHTAADVRHALGTESPNEETLAALLSPAAAEFLEPMAARAQALTRRHFGRTVQLYVPLYLSSWCSGGCAYCGFASDRQTERHALDYTSVAKELDAIKAMGFEEVLLLTGERCPKADVDYLRDCVRIAAQKFHNVAIEVFPMAEEEYRILAEAGATSVTMYQETYHPETYDLMHRWGPKKDMLNRLEAPARALSGGLRFAGLGALLGLSDPQYDMLALYRHARHLQKTYWQAGLTISFPRIRNEVGGFDAPYPVDEKMLAQIIFAFRICLPDVPLVLSTREGAAFRDGMAGLGISKMSIASKTTVGGYGDAGSEEGQFDVSDARGLHEFCDMLRSKDLEPVFKNWDSTYR
ncbi:2-iminoacetate synthase ThiH [Tichowtungia aerotolerans]|uniref:2-iminoacetate synthase ThiH n=1 Tax=Tichowtungia aerotolerans TaxID=2697043 RepID=UPI0038CD6486